MMNTIEVRDLKKYFGQTKAVDGISFNIQEGEIFGFLGPNGAGKTTTIRCMMDFIRPTAGSVTILGHDAQKQSVLLKKSIGYLSGEGRLYDSWTGYDHINLTAKIRGKSPRASELLEKLDFDPTIKVKNLSTGNKQKLSLILALIHRPKILILDEPTVGLDPLLQNTIYDLLREFSKQGSTVFMSSHNLHEVELICSRVGIIKEGKMVATESIRDLRVKKLYQVSIYFEDPFNPHDFRAEGMEIISSKDEMLVLHIKGDIRVMLQKLLKYRIKDIEISRASLEDIFLEFYKKEQK